MQRVFLRLLFLLLLFKGNAIFAIGGEESSLRRAFLIEKDETKRYYRQLSLARYYLKNNIAKSDSIRSNLMASSRQEKDSARFLALVYDLEVEKLLGNKQVYYSKILQLQPFLNKLKSNVVKIQIFQYLADYYIATREYPQAELYLELAQKLAKRIRQYDLIGRNFQLYAVLEMQRNNKVKALRYIDESIQYARRSPDKGLLASCVNTQASIYQYFGQIELSVSKNYIAFQLAKEANDYPKLSLYQMQIGESQLFIYNYPKATSEFNQAKETAERINDKRLIGLILTNLGVVAFDRKDYGKAIVQLKSAITILSQFNDQDGLGKAHKFLGSVFKEKSEYNEALRYYNQALVYYESVGNRPEIAAVYHLVGTVFEKQGKYKNALNYLERAVAIRSEFGFQGAVYPTYREIAEVYKKTGNIRLAYEFLEKYSNYSDSSKLLEVSTKVAEISELYRAEQRERLIAMQADSIDLQRKEKDLTSTKLENAELRSIFQTYVIIGFLILLILGAVILYNRWKQRNIKQLQREAEMNQVLLRSQMNPHFVFNAMSVIQSYIYENDIKNSTKFLVNFSKLMRLILENSSKEFISLETEKDILQRYLEMQKLRFGDRFEFEIIIPEGLLEQDVVIPPMITQPFIENAIEHGQLHTVDGGFIRIEINEDENMLHVTIKDNGIGRKGAEQNKKSKEHKSMAMKITQDRIDNLSYKYRIQGRMEIEDFNKQEQTGTLVNLYLPFRTEKQGE